MKAPRPETAIAVIAASAVAIVLLIVALIAVFAHKQTSTEKTAQHATTTAQHATHAVAGKASKGALKRTDHTAKVAHTAAVRVEHRLTVVRQDFTRVVNVNGLRGLAGRAGINGKDAVFPFTLADIVARIPAPLTGPQGPAGVDGRDGSPPTQDQVNDGVALKIAQALVDNCGGSCKGDPGQAGSDGANGVDGTNGTNGTNGADAPPPTQAQVDQACLDVGCASQVPGPQGATGATGPQGPPVTTVVCEPPDAAGNQACTVTG